MQKQENRIDIVFILLWKNQIENSSNGGGQPDGLLMKTPFEFDFALPALIYFLEKLFPLQHVALMSFSPFPAPHHAAGELLLSAHCFVQATYFAWLIPSTVFCLLY